MKNATIKFLLPNAFAFSHIKNRFLQRNSSSESENFTSRFFIGLWRSCCEVLAVLSATRKVAGAVAGGGGRSDGVSTKSRDAISRILHYRGAPSARPNKKAVQTSKPCVRTRTRSDAEFCPLLYDRPSCCTRPSSSPLSLWPRPLTKPSLTLVAPSTALTLPSRYDVFCARACTH